MACQPGNRLAIDNCEVILLDQHQQVVPRGVLGELYLGGRAWPTATMAIRN